MNFLDLKFIPGSHAFVYGTYVPTAQVLFIFPAHEKGCLSALLPAC